MSEPVLHAAVPILAVSDMDRSIEFYRTAFGFEIGWIWGDPVELASVCRGEVELNLSLAQDEPPPFSRVYIRMTDVDALFEAAKAAGVEMPYPLQDREYGMRDFRALDPDGNQLSFGEAIRG